jgi:hypothetical protein
MLFIGTSEILMRSQRVQVFDFSVLGKVGDQKKL